jgi:3-oxoacyl-[acyl-carrier-protein] synthase II
MGAGNDVVVTSVGMVSPAGIGVGAYRQAVLSGTSGIVAITQFKADDLVVRIAGMVQKLEPEAVLTPSELAQSPRAVQMVMVAARECMGSQDAAREKMMDPTRVGVVMGVCSSGFDVLTRELDVMSKAGPSALDAGAVPQLMDNGAASMISLKWGVQGPSYCVATACATSMDCLGIGYDLIRSGRVDACIVGGGDAAVTRFAISAFGNARALSRNNDNPTMASRPFDKDRDGFVMAEAAGVFFLERRDRAEKRGAPIIARLCGYGTTNDAHHLVTPRPDGSGLASAMQLGLDFAGIKPSDVGYISAHATSTEQGDVAETAAIHHVLGKHVDNVKVGATKSLFGHSIGGAGAISSLAAVLAVSEGILTPVISYRTPDPECNLPVFATTLTGQKVNYALANAAGFGGQNSTLVFGAP